MKTLNKLISIVLCLVLLSNIAIPALAEEPSNNVKDLISYRVPVISNEYTDKTVVFYEHQGKYYLDIEDIKNFTRSTVSETDSKIVITHGIRELEIDKSTGHLIDSTIYDQGTIPFLVYEGKYLCEGIPMLMYLGAACTIRDEVALEVLMPSITIWESIMPDYLDYYFNITELYGGENNVKISLICDILSDVLDGVSGHGLFADGDTHLEDALFEILEIDMMKYTSVQEAVATKNQDINDFLSSDAVGTLLEGGSNATDTVSEVLDYYADFYLETEILKNNVRWQHSYNVGDIDSTSKLSKQINSQVYEQSSIKVNLGTYENLADILDLGMIAFDTAITSYSLMQYDDDTKNLFARTINEEMFDYVGYNEISWTNVSNRISNKLSSKESIVASTAVENLTEYVVGELAEGGTVQALSAFTSKANIYVAATQIATFVSSLINKDLHEAYSADMNAIWLNAVQYDIARLTTQVLLKAGEEEKFSNVESIKKLKDMFTLYYRTTIAFSENIAVSINEFGNKNKDEWVKYFSSTTEASVANYVAQYLYRITNCTIVPIVEYSKITDDVLTSNLFEKSTNEAGDIWKEIPNNFTFSSGVGAWRTEITISDDGTFIGQYTDSDAGATGYGYSNGTCYISEFSGKFSNPERINEFTYSMTLENLTLQNNPGEEYYENNIKYICSEPYGFEDAQDFYLYLPGAPVSDLPEDFLSWAHLASNASKLPPNYYGIYNSNAATGFVATKDNSIAGKQFYYYYGSNKSAFWPSYTMPSSHLVFWFSEGASVIDLCFDWSEDETEFVANDSKGSGEYDLTITVSDNLETVTIKINSKSGTDLTDWGGTADGSLVAEYKVE